MKGHVCNMASDAKKNPKADASGTGGSKVGCLVTGCKGQDSRLGFCAEHFEHYKFGLVNRKGEKVPDYEKKIEHFRDYQAQKRSFNKVAG